MTAPLPDPLDAPIPRLSLILGFGPMIPLLLAGIMVWLLPGLWPAMATGFAIWWGAVILTFLAGVRRGLTFKMPDGARSVDLVSMVWLFLLGAGALIAPNVMMSLVLLLLGYGSVAVLDSAAAQVGVAPAYFARLRPQQMAIAILGLLAVMFHQAAMRYPV